MAKSRRAEHTLRRSLEQTLIRGSIEERYFAAEQLGQLLRNRRAAPEALLRATSDRSPLVRTTVVESLGYIKDPAARRYLVRSLNDSSAVVRAYAAASLGRIGPAKMRRLLNDKRREERSVRARIGIAEGLLWLKDSSALAVLLRSLRSKQYRVRCAAANALAALPLTTRDRVQAADAINRALESETTVAARSSLENARRAVR